MYAYVDESGNHDLDTSKGGNSGFFVVCAVIVREQFLDRANEGAEALRKRHFQTGEIKSSKVKSQDTNEIFPVPTKLQTAAEVPLPDLVASFGAGQQAGEVRSTHHRK